MPDQFDSRSYLFFYLSSYRFRIIIAVGVSACPCCCRLISVDTYATCHMHALSTLELRGGPEYSRAI